MLPKVKASPRPVAAGAVATKTEVTSPQPPPTKAPDAFSPAAVSAPAPEPFPFSQGADGGLSAPVDFHRFLGMHDPTQADVVAKTKTLLVDYLKTGQFGQLTGEGGIPLRYAVFAPPPGTPVKGVINLFAGRGESFVKYAETLFNLRDLRAQGYVIASMDHRGQGLSGRELADPQKDYVGTFEDFVKDQAKFTGVLRDHFGTTAPYMLVAHSMGGAIATRYLEEHPGEYRRATLLSPMLDIETPMPDALANVVADVASAVIPESYAFGQKPYAPHAFAGNKLTNSPERLEMENQIESVFPDTKLGGATWGWLHQAIKADRTLMQPEELDKLEGVDLHMLRATADQLVQTGAEDQFAQYTGADVKSYFYTAADGTQQGTQHELLFHTDDVRNRVLSDLRHIITAPFSAL
jgi:lysophospholipase